MSRKRYWIAQRIKSLTGQHINWDTISDDKNVRLNSRNYPGTTGDSSGVQIKPNRSVDGTASVTGLEASPRFAAGIGGANLVGIKADPLLKAGAGDITGSVKAVEANIDFGISGTRTITGDIAAFESFLAVPSTYTYSGDKTFLKVRTPNIAGWDYFLKAEANAGIFDETGGTYSTAQGFLKVKINGTDYRIPFYDGVD